jgi:hypothetical protein
MSDYYRDRVRHGGILSNTFIGELKHQLLPFWPALIDGQLGGGIARWFPISMA